MKKISRFAVVAAAMFLLVGAVPAMAIPQLQLYIEGATYDQASQTWVTTDDSFTLGAYMIEKSTGGATSLADTYFLTMAFLGAPGSFEFNGAPIGDAGLTLNFGTPPADGDGNPGTLPGHGIFPAYYYQYAFNFSADSQVDPTNLAVDEESGEQVWFGGPVPEGTGMYEKLFLFDLTGLEAGIHFDLFNTVADAAVDVQKFAPFSHDAEGNQVPEPGTLVLFGSGLVGLAAYGRKRFLA